MCFIVRILVAIEGMAEGPADEQHGGSMNAEQGLLIQQKQSATPNSRGISSPGSSGKKPGYYSENGYLMELSRRERHIIKQEINKRFKPGDVLLKLFW